MPKLNIIGESGEVIAPFAISIEDLEITIGRGETNSLMLEDAPSISTNHGTIKRVFGGYIYKDLGSSNGSSMNGEPITKVFLESGVTLYLGDVPFQFEYTADELAALAKEELNPQVYVEEEHLPQLRALHQHQVSVESNERTKLEPTKTQSFKVPNRNEAPYTPPRNVVTHVEDGPNPFVSLLAAIVFCAVGLFGGVYFKHYQETEGGNFIEDFKSGKVVSIFTQK